MKPPDLYSALKDLLNQVPSGRVTTINALAEAIGDRAAERTISEMLNIRAFRHLQSKVSQYEEAPSPYSDFESDRPLCKLAEAQRDMARKVIQEGVIGSWERVAGVDASYHGDKARAACVVMDRRLKVIDSRITVVDVGFPYIPSYLSYRESPALLSAIEGVSDFDIILVNGHGVAHPRRCGLASVIGLMLDVPTIGVARRVLVGEILEREGGFSPLIFEGACVGAKVSKEGRAPIFVSVGHLISFENCLEIVRELWGPGRLPEPLNVAHRLTKSS